ncbi:tetratricopeptide repeat protein [Hyphobacterium sp. HN65]|uniref:Tetratricopeptide repeat protein n=1 Tax=Hyphobacterium lacteum TaxID=3116575 RepID=A0ABU7LPW3_9PROT|nr:tetratricopeptide repeat protein [Hyphobacterium sp. HN65]MEE2525947.1 tetratricopeptide repeat protein [Hyphobacterium sp. HN65]
MTDLLAELRRRNVFRVAAAYLVVGWLVLQVVGAIETSAGLPSWTDGFALVLLITGFPIVLFIAWAFELTPEGLKKTSAADEKTGFRPLGTTDFVLIGLLVIVLGVAGFQIATRDSAAGPDGLLAEANAGSSMPVLDASIAVLPFVDLSPEGDQAYFGDGIAEEILNVLTRVNGLHVASRTSAFQFRGDEFGIPAIAQELNVRHILEGSVRKAGSTLRITAQLIDSETDQHLWSDTFDRPLSAENIFAIQDEIATEIVHALSETLGMDPPEVSVSTDTENLDAYELYLRGQAIFHRRSFDNIPDGIAYFEQAVDADPDFARGWAGLAAIYGIADSWIGGGEANRDFDALALVAADRATALDANLSLPYSVRSNVARRRLEWTEALNQSNAAIERDPTSANAWYFRGSTWLDAGFFDRAVTDFEACLDRDPDYEICRRFLAFAELYRGNTDVAIELFEASILTGQKSYMQIMVPVYFAVRDNATALYYLAYLSESRGNLEYLEANYHFNGDFSTTNAELERMLRAAYFRENGSLEGYRAPTFEFDETTFPVQSFDLRWNPFQPNRFRPEMSEGFAEARHGAIEAAGLPDFWREHGFPPQCQPVGEDDFECGWYDAEADG